MFCFSCNRGVDGEDVCARVCRRVSVSVCEDCSLYYWRGEVCDTNHHEPKDEGEKDSPTGRLVWTGKKVFLGVVKKSIR